MRTLVTGASGLLGNNIVRRLLERGEEVRVLMRSSADPRPLAGLDVETCPGDLRSADAVRQACRGVDCVVHAAAFVAVGWAGLDEARAVNVEGTRNVCDAVLEFGPRLVYVSTVDTLAAGSPERPADEDCRGEKIASAYIVTKREAEHVAEAAFARGIQGAIALPGYMLGPWDWKPSSGRMLLTVAKRYTPAAPSGGLSVCDVRDVADAILTAREVPTPGRRFILAGHNLPFIELWGRMRTAAGRRGRPWMRLGPLMRWIGGAAGDLTYRCTGREPDINSAAVRLSALYHFYSSARAEAELGYRIRPLDETLTDAWNWFVEHGYVDAARRS